MLILACFRELTALSVSQKSAQFWKGWPAAGQKDTFALSQQYETDQAFGK